MQFFIRGLVVVAALGLTALPVDAQKEQVYRPGNGVSLPVVIESVTPQYTADAMRAKIKGSAIVEVTVTAKGEVTDVELTRSLDPVHGLDNACIEAAAQWKFKPGTKDGKPVAVRVWIEMTFNMGN